VATGRPIKSDYLTLTTEEKEHDKPFEEEKEAVPDLSHNCSTSVVKKLKVESDC